MFSSCLHLHILIATTRRTDAEAEAYIHSTYFSTVSLDDLTPVFAAYPSDPTVGSPFDTGSANAITPQFKRIAAIQGDLVFQAPRRFFLQQRSDKQKTWAFRETFFLLLFSYFAHAFLKSPIVSRAPRFSAQCVFYHFSEKVFYPLITTISSTAATC